MKPPTLLCLRLRPLQGASRIALRTPLGLACQPRTFATAMGEPDYNKWTKQGLVERVKALEAELAQRSAGGGETEVHVRPGASASAPEAVREAPADAEDADMPPPRKKQKKEKKEISAANYSTRFIALKLAYLGKNYNGFEMQAQGGASTIEEELWKALVKSCLIFPKDPQEIDFSICEYSKCGRTDRGVSAFGQVIALRVRSNKPVREQNAVTAGGGEGDQTATGTVAEEEQDDSPCPVEDEVAYCRVLNRLLPPDIRILAWCPSPPPGFSARFSCRERQYRYFFTQPAFAPAPGALEGPRPEGRPKEGWLDIEAMCEAARLFEGEHDFRNFCKVDASKQISNFVRRVFAAYVTEVPDAESALAYLQRPELRPDGAAPGRAPKVYSFNVRGSAFLWHQIRHMVAVLFLVGQGLERPSVVRQLLDVSACPRRPGYVLADETPLVLWDCVFPGEGNPEGRDALGWVWPGEEDLHGRGGLVNHLWRGWRERKMDELLAGRLLGYAAERADRARGGVGEKQRPAAGPKVFDGGNAPASAGRYVPVMERPLLPAPEDVNNKFARQKGFADSAAMRAAGSWREVVKAAKAAGAGGDGQPGTEPG